MIFQALNNLKRSSVMTSIMLMTLGILMLICPEAYVPTMVSILGAILLVLALVGIFSFLGSNKALIHYIYLTGWLLVGVLGCAILIFEIDSLKTISWLFGAYLFLTGAGNMYNAFVYAKRAGMKAWWVLVPLTAAQIVSGLVILINPWWNTPGALFRAVGFILLFSSFVSIIHLIIIWPIKE